MKRPWPLIFLFVCGLACAADVNGAELSVLWGVPLADILLSIVIAPLLVLKSWHDHYGKVATAQALVLLVPFGVVFGPGTAIASVNRAALAECIPFTALIVALYIVTGGTCTRSNLHGAPKLNVGLIVLGTTLASIIGTTGATMLLIRPLLWANEARRHHARVVAFFIFLVTNAGGALTLLGDPSLLLGSLQDADSLWTTQHLWRQTLMMWVLPLATFFVIDNCFYHSGKEGLPNITDATPDDAGPLRFEGNVNFVLLTGILGLVLVNGPWKPGTVFYMMGMEVLLQNATRDVGLVVIALLSLQLTPGSARAGNEFNREPILEVAKLFVGIFVTIGPVIAILKAGVDGPFAGIIHLANDSAGQPNNAMHFRAMGSLPPLLDNVPMCLVFFNIVGGDASILMSEGASTPAAISAAVVSMGANIYIDNAPNLMVKAVAESRSSQIPSFFGYMLWFVCIFLPIFVLTISVFFHQPNMC